MIGDGEVPKPRPVGPAVGSDGESGSSPASRLDLSAGYGEPVAPIDPEQAAARGAAPDPSAGPPFRLGPIWFGLAVMAFFCSSFTAWSYIAPLESAVVAPGIVRVDSSTRTVQHLEGGIIEAILVHEGDAVEAGQVLIRLQGTVAASERNEILSQYFEARATQARLEAERDGLDDVVVPADLRQRMMGDQALASAIRGQVSIFKSRRGLLSERLTILERTRAGLETEIDGLEGQIAAAERRRALIEEQLKDASTLYSQKLAIKSKLLELEGSVAELEGSISQSKASIGGAQERIQEAELKMAELKSSMATEVVEQLRETRASAYELSQRLTAAEDKMGRTEIRSPASGIVVGLQVHTIGGVIAAGQPLLDVVPTNDKLVIQANINPLDIDQVKVGLKATVWLSAINRRTQSAIEGEVRTVSAEKSHRSSERGRLLSRPGGARHGGRRAQRDNAAAGDERRGHDPNGSPHGI